MKLVYFLLRYSRSMVLVAVFAGIVSGASSTGLLALINRALKESGHSTATLAWAFVALCAVVTVTRIISEVLLARLGQGALLDMRKRLSRQILAVPLRRLEDLGPHRLLTALTDDVPNITNIVALIPILCINGAIVIGCLIYLGTLSWIMLLVVLGFMVLGIASYQIPVMRAIRHFNLARKDGDALFSHFRALTEGLKELKLHNRRRKAFLSDLLEPTAESLRQHNMDGFTIYTAASSWGQLLVFVVIGLLLFALPAFKEASSATLTGYTLALLFMMTPLQVIMNSAPNIGRANVALRNVEELGLKLMPSASEQGEVVTPVAESQWRRLDLVGITHVYKSDGEDGSFTLGPIDLTFYSEELVFLTGGNGSGKTTLAKLLTGLYIPETGEVLLDGKPVTDENREYYREHFSVVFSDFFLFESLLGLDAPRIDERAQQYLAQLQLTHKVQVKDGELSTVNLSQGQRKRLALLTAYLEDRPFYIFDEWAADQDPMFREVFYHQLLPELKSRGKTVLVISHDDRYYHIGDRIIKLDYGQLAFDEPVSLSQNAPEEMPIPSR